MPIDDILREQGYSPKEQTTERQQQQQRQPARQGTFTLELPDPTDGDMMAMLFWLNVLQTAAILYLLIRSG